MEGGHMSGQNCHQDYTYNFKSRAVQMYMNHDADRIVSIEHRTVSHSKYFIYRNYLKIRYKF